MTAARVTSQAVEALYTSAAVPKARVTSQAVEALYTSSAVPKARVTSQAVEVLYSPPGPQALTPSLFTNTNTFYDPVILGSASISITTSNPTVAVDATETSGAWVGQQNNILWSESLNNAAWAKNFVTVTTDATTAPDGTMTADKAIPNSSNAGHYIYQDSQILNTVKSTFSVDAKAAGYNFIQLTSSSGLTGAGSAYVNFNLTTGAIGNHSGASITYSIVSIGDGWYRCSITDTGNSTAQGRFLIAILNADTASRLPTYVGDTTSGVHLWGMQMSYNTASIPYVRSDGSIVGTFTTGRPTIAISAEYGTADVSITTSKPTIAIVTNGFVVPDLFTNSNSFYTPAISVGSVALTPSLFTNSNSFYTALVLAPIFPSLYTNSNSFYTHVVTPGVSPLTPSLFTNSNSFYTPAISVGPVELTPNLFTNSNSFYTHTATPGIVHALPSLFTNSNLFYAPRISQNLLPSLLTHTQTFYTGEVHTGFVGLFPSLATNSNTFYTPTATKGAVALTPSLFVDLDIFYSATVSRGAVALNPGLFTNSNVIYAGKVSHTLKANLLTNSNVFYSGSITTGGVSILPGFFVNSNTFFDSPASHYSTRTPKQRKVFITVK